MRKLFGKDRRMHWPVVSILTGLIWGIWKESFWAGFIFASMMLVGGLLVELYRNRDKK